LSLEVCSKRTNETGIYLLNLKGRDKSRRDLSLVIRLGEGLEKMGSKGGKDYLEKLITKFVFCVTVIRTLPK